jgi:hypothetical protein
MHTALLSTSSSTPIAILQGLIGIAAFSAIFLAPGYLWASTTNLANFKLRSRAEQILWSIALSTPLAIALCALAGRHLSSSTITILFLLIDLAAAIQLLRSKPSLTLPKQTTTRWMIALMALFGLFCILAVTDIQIGHRLYISTVIADWSVRVAMVNAAIRSGVPPINGLSTLRPDGHAPHLRYYYFWYVVVAQLARVLHLRAHAALAASCAWAGWGLIATAFLALKYLANIRHHLRAKCLLLLLLGATLGLDILPTALLWISPKLHPYAEMEWWHQDRTPSFLGSVLYAPHHMAAFACLLTGFLVLFITAQQQTTFKTFATTQLPAALFAGIAFAAAAGTSLFPTFCFVFILALWAIDLTRRRQWPTIAALALSGLLALAFAHGYLQELSTTSSAASGFANFAWRNDAFVAMELARRNLLALHNPTLAALARQPLVLLMDFFEFGFYTLVLIHRLRRDILTPTRLTAAQSALWSLVLGASIPFLFLTSRATSGPNDLGVDAGFLLRLGLQLWSVQYVWTLWQRRHDRKPVLRRAIGVFAELLLCLGLTAQLYQSLSERLYYPLIGSNLIPKQMDSLTKDHLAERLYNIRQALREFDTQVPPSAPDTNSIQFNPIGTMLPAEVIYTDHQIASWDTGCGTSYGGDYTSCAPIYQSLLHLFGNTEAGVLSGRASNDREDAAAPTIASTADFNAVCARLHTRAIMAESTDSIWSKPTSWVWTQTPMVANQTVRILPCPTTGASLGRDSRAFLGRDPSASLGRDSSALLGRDSSALLGRD